MLSRWHGAGISPSCIKARGLCRRRWRARSIWFCGPCPCRKISWPFFGGGQRARNPLCACPLRGRGLPAKPVPLESFLAGAGDLAGTVCSSLCESRTAPLNIARLKQQVERKLAFPVTRFSIQRALAILGEAQLLSLGEEAVTLCRRILGREPSGVPAFSGRQPCFGKLQEFPGIPPGC
jgi:hypothetical protein